MANGEEKIDLKQLEIRLQELEELEKEHRKDIQSLRASEEKLAQQNLLLNVVFRINELILRNKEPERLVRDICELLVVRRGYVTSWMVLFDSRGKISHSHSVGFPDAFPEFISCLDKKEYPLCVQMSIYKQRAFTINKPDSVCKNCPLGSRHKDRSARTIRLEYNNYLYGLLSVSIPHSLISDEEYALFDALASNISHALYSVQLEQAKERQLKELFESERQRVHAAALAERAARLATLGVMAGSITHEINQPLNAIKVNADNLKFWHENNGNNVPDYFKQVVEDISSGVDRIDQIVQYMRNYWKSSSGGRLEQVDLNETIRRVRFLLDQKLASHNIQIELSLYEKTPPVMARSIQVEQIIINLVNNAIYALDTSDRSLKTIWIQTRIVENHPSLIIRDNGVGIEDTLLNNLFTPFPKTDQPDSKGMGLGLTIVKMFLEQFDAQINASNHPEGGAILTIRFPAQSAVKEVKAT